jgi:hypothetical protein
MVLLQVKWNGYDNPADLTWEPERFLRYVDHAQPLHRVMVDLLTDSSIGAISHRFSMHFLKNEEAETRF